MLEESFTVARNPATVFDYLTDPERLPDWQTAKVSIGFSRLIEPLVRRMVARQFGGYHEHLRRNVEGLPDA